MYLLYQINLVGFFLSFVLLCFIVLFSIIRDSYVSVVVILGVKPGISSVDQEENYTIASLKKVSNGEHG